MLVPLGSLEALAGHSYSGHALGAGGCSEPPTSLVKATICSPDGLARRLAQRDPSLRSPLLDLPPGALVKVMGDDRSLRPHCPGRGSTALSAALSFHRPVHFFGSGPPFFGCRAKKSGISVLCCPVSRFQDILIDTGHISLFR